MKKFILCGIALVAGLMSCTEDYKDWANPQSNAGSELNPKFEMTLQPTASAIDFATETGNQIQLFTTNLQEGQTSYYNVLLESVGSDKDVTIIADVDGKVQAEDLIDAVKQFWGAAPVERTLIVTVSTEVKVTTEDGVVTVHREANPYELKVTLAAPYIDADGYYVVGNIDGWACKLVNDYHMVNNGGEVYDNPEFSVEIKPVDGITTYEIKAIPAADFNADGSIASWDRAFSAAEGVDEPAYEGTLSNTNKGGNIKFDAVEDAVSYTLTINAMTSTYTVEANMKDQSIYDTTPVLYLTGDYYSWGGSEDDWKPLVPVYGNENLSWKIIYLHEWEKIKFAPQKGWGNDFGYDAESVVDKAEAGAQADGSNLMVSKAGWYLLKVDKTAGARKIEILKPEVYLIGNTSPTSWDVAEAGLFEVPTTEKGKFVSPAFVADNEVRMCVKLGDDIDWWKTEFIVNANGIIDYRGNGGDQPRVNVTTGQKCYLNFTYGSGSYK